MKAYSKNKLPIAADKFASGSPDQDPEYIRVDKVWLVKAIEGYYVTISLYPQGRYSKQLVCAIFS